MTLLRRYTDASTTTKVLAVVAASAAGASLGIAAVEAALVVDFALAQCPTSPTAQSNSSYLLSVLLLCLIPVGAVVGGLLWRRLPIAVWLGIGLAAWAATVGLYELFDGIVNGGLLSRC